MKLTADEIAAGMAWYPAAEQHIELTARQHEKSFYSVAGAVAALSPRVSWGRNIALVELVLSGYDKIGLKRNIAKAKRCLAGEAPSRVLKGSKVQAFYQALIGFTDAVVLDVWMLRYLAPKSQGRVTTRQYAKLAARLTREAARAGLMPRDYQAAVWLKLKAKAQAKGAK